MKSPKKLMWKIFTFLIGFCALLLLILWIFETTFLEKMYEGVRKKEIKNAIKLVEDNINSPNLDNIIISLREDSEIIVSPSNSFVIPNRGRHSGKMKMRQAITESRDFVTEDGSVVTLVFYAIISPVNATIATIKVQLYYVTFIMIFLSIILAYIIAKAVSKPIEDLNDSAKLLAKGEYHTKFSGEGYREIHELSHTLNYTASELSKVEELRRELMANISHDLRTPLALIYSYAELMHDFPEEINKEQTDMIMKETSRLSSLVEDIFNLSQLETGNMELNISKYNLSESIKNTINSVAEFVKNEGFNIYFEKEEDVYVNGDEVKINQAFYNLLINAIHYSGDSKEIIVRQIVKNNKVRIEIEDFGIGIEKENMSKIWNRYYKTDNSHRRSIIGTGLGLSIVKKIMDLHGLDYGVESELGKGSIFWFSLKVA